MSLRAGAGSGTAARPAGRSSANGTCAGTLRGSLCPQAGGPAASGDVEEEDGGDGRWILDCVVPKAAPGHTRARASRPWGSPGSVSAPAVSRSTTPLSGAFVPSTPWPGDFPRPLWDSATPPPSGRPLRAGWSARPRVPRAWRSATRRKPAAGSRRRARSGLTRPHAAELLALGPCRLLSHALPHRRSLAVELQGQTWPRNAGTDVAAKRGSAGGKCCGAIPAGGCRPVTKPDAVGLGLLFSAGGAGGQQMPGFDDKSIPPRATNVQKWSC